MNNVQTYILFPLVGGIITAIVQTFYRYYFKPSKNDN